MLKQLRLEHFVIFPSCELSFSTGFTVLTGETGAGKSIIIDAIGLLLGEQASETFIQHGHDSAIIEGIFQLETVPDAIADFIEDQQLIIYRKLTRNGQNQIRINNQSSTLKTLKKVGTHLANIMGQHAHMSLLDPQAQGDLLDHYAGAPLNAALANYKTLYQDYSQLHAQKQRFDQNRSEAEQRLAFLQFQLDDISQHQLQRNEESQLQDQKKQIKNAATIRQSLSQLSQSLGSATQAIHDAQAHLQPLLAITPAYQAQAERLKEQQLVVEDISDHFATVTAQSQQLDETDIEQIEARLDIIFKLKTKYRTPSLEALLDLVDERQKEVDTLTALLSDNQASDGHFEQLHGKVLDSAKQLSQLRQAAAQSLASAILDNLTQLQLPHAKLEIPLNFDPSQLGPTGADQPQFMMTLNPGDSLKPLQKVASGGELSRLMLAIRRLFYNHNPVPTIVYDEVDTGIGGLVANTLGQFLKDSAKQAQVLCVTHLPQIAQFADTHLSVVKHTQPDCTVTTLSVLQGDEIRQELARMVGGETVVANL